MAIDLNSDCNLKIVIKIKGKTCHRNDINFINPKFCIVHSEQILASVGVFKTTDIN
jgi:hypothetical protein